MEDEKRKHYDISPKSGRIRKRVRVRYKKKKPVFTRKSLKKLISNPLLLLLIILALALVTYYFMPASKGYIQKYRITDDEATRNANKKINNTDVYH